MSKINDNPNQPCGDECPPKRIDYSRRNLSYRSLIHSRTASLSPGMEQGSETVKWTGSAVAKRPKTEVLTPSQVLALMTMVLHTRRSLIPVLALQIFAGLRWAEAAQARPRDILAGHGETFEVTGAKTGSRQIPICNSLRAWLATSPPSHADTAWPASISSYRRKMKDSLKMIGYTNNHASLRCIYYQYRLAMTRDVPRLASESGTPLSLLDSTAQMPIEPDAAKAFFELKPPIGW